MTIKNQFKTIALLGILTAIFLWIGSFFGTGGLTIAIIIALTMNLGSYWFSDKLVLKMYKAESSLDEDLNNMVKELCKQNNQPLPKVYLIPTDSPNAFATGRDPKHSAIAFTKGILDILNKEELKGVAAHELSHIKNRDTLIQTIAATIAGVISYVALVARFGMFFGNDDNNILQLLMLAIVTPIMATIIQLAISRSREYLADESAARLIKDGNPLADALIKLEGSAKKLRFGNKATASLFIVNPFTKKGIVQMFSTHPSTEERIKRLREKR